MTFAMAILLLRATTIPAAFAFECEAYGGVVTGTIARIRSVGKMAHDELVAPHQFPPAIFRHSVWLDVRFTLSYRDVEDLLAERGLDVWYETARRWVLKLGRCSPKNFAVDSRSQRLDGKIPHARECVGQRHGDCPRW
jgi:hypothetical protein